MNYRVLRVILVTLVVLGLLGIVDTRPAHADCGLGDIICEMQQAIQQLIDNYVGPLKQWAIFQTSKALYQTIYQAEKSIAGAQWSLAKSQLSVGIGIGVLNNWASDNFFQPMIATSSQTFTPIISFFLFLALLILGITYLLAVFVRLDVVSPRSMAVWYLAGLLFFQIGPSFYASMNDLRQTLNSFFYASSLNAVQGQSPFAQLANGDSSRSSAIYGMSSLCNNFPAYISSPPGTFSGLDIGLAYVKADGLDVLTNGARCLGGGDATDLPRSWYDAGGYFDLAQSPDSWTMPAYPAPIETAIAQMQASIQTGFAGMSRLLNTTPTIWVGIVEQLVALCLMVAQGLTFISFSCAILFAFFRRTEAIAWAIIDQWVGLIVQTVVIAMVQAMTIALYMSSAATGSPLITLAVSVVGLVFMGILLWSGFKAIWNAFNKLFEAFGQATGGAVVSTGQALQTTVNMGGAVAGAALTGGASLMAGATALGSGATVAQAAGVAFGENHAFTNAASTLFRLPGLRGSPLGEAADQFLEGAKVQSVARDLPGGSLFSPLVGAQLLTDRNPEDATYTDQGYLEARPMLNPGVGRAMTVFASNPGWRRHPDAAEEDEPGVPQDGETRLSRTERRGQFTPVHPVHGIDDDEVLEIGSTDASASPDAVPATIGINAADSDLDEQMKTDMTAVMAGSPVAAAGDVRLGDAANRLSEAASSVGKDLSDAGNTLERAAHQQEMQQRMRMYQGELSVSGPGNMAGVMGDLVALLQQQRADTGQSPLLRGSESLNNYTVANGLAAVTGVTPLADGKPPVRADVGRFGLFADQALRMGITGDMADQVVQEVHTSGAIQPETRGMLHAQVEQQTGWQPSRVDRAVDTLQARAAMLPDELRVVGAMPLPTPDTAPTVVSPEPPVPPAPAKPRLPVPPRPLPQPVDPTTTDPVDD